MNWASCSTVEKFLNLTWTHVPAGMFFLSDIVYGIPRVELAPGENICILDHLSLVLLYHVHDRWNCQWHLFVSDRHKYTIISENDEIQNVSDLIRSIKTSKLRLFAAEI